MRIDWLCAQVENAHRLVVCPGPKVDPQVASVFSAALRFDNEIASLVATTNPDTATATLSGKGGEDDALQFMRWPLAEPIKAATVEVSTHVNEAEVC